MDAINKLINGIFEKTRKNEHITELEWVLDIAYKDTGIDKGTINKAAEELAALEAENARLQRIAELAGKYVYWVDVYLKTRTGASPLVMMDAEKEADAFRKSLLAALGKE